MKVMYIHIIALVFLSSCSQPTIEKPIWVDAADTITLEQLPLNFKASPQHWNALLYTILQPVPLRAFTFGEDLQLVIIDRKGLIEGPATLCLSAKNKKFFYPVYLKNASVSSINTKEYRSPKTVNPDSSMQQQRIIYRLDNYRNLQLIELEQYFFFEENITLAPYAGTFQAVKDQPLSSYYVQPGSCTSITINADYLITESSYQITTGTLKDQFGNKVSDGTLVVFMFSTADTTGRMEAAVRQATATVKLPVRSTEKYTVWAEVDATFSNKLILEQ